MLARLMHSSLSVSHPLSEPTKTYTHALEVFQQWCSLKRTVTLLSATLVSTTVAPPAAGPTQSCQELDASLDVER